MQFTQVHRVEQEKVFISVQNNQGATLSANDLVRFSATTTASEQGRLVELVDAVSHTITNAQGSIAGVVEADISTGEVGRVQVYGPSNVRADTTIAASTAVVASTATAEGSVAAIASAGGNGALYADAIVGWTLQASSSATTAVVFVKTL